jgi:riboflavin-specific deaminase-like protein
MTQPDSPAWRLIRAAAAFAREPQVQLENGCHYAWQGGALISNDEGGGVLAWQDGWHALGAMPAGWDDHDELYLTLGSARAAAPIVVGQLGQSLDGFIATASGDSHYVTGKASLVHLHRLRALCDCVIVGAGTVAADDPRLTTRLASGPHPLRVVLDPRLRLAATHQVFTDGQAPTLRVRAEQVPLPPALASAQVEDIALPAPAGRLDLAALLAVLHARGHQAILVEGGGITLSAFFASGLLDRLHVVVAPFIMGEGRPGLRVASPARLQDCPRPASRVYAMGSDVLFDCDLRTPQAAQHTGFIKPL